MCFSCNKTTKTSKLHSYLFLPTSCHPLFPSYLSHLPFFLPSPFNLPFPSYHFLPSLPTYSFPPTLSHLLSHQPPTQRGLNNLSPPSFVYENQCTPLYTLILGWPPPMSWRGNIRGIGPLVHRGVGPHMHWVFSQLVHGEISPLVHRGVGPHMHWVFSQLVHGEISPLVHRGVL